jgi:hypothetical protein
MGLRKKLDACKQGLRQWRDNAQEPKFGTITLMKAQLADLQDQEEVGNNESISQLKHDIQVQLGKEDLWWRQRAKVNWLKYGDMNTQYFHACVQSQRKKNIIERILDEGGSGGSPRMEWVRPLLTTLPTFLQLVGMVI